jgi:hypothetical protein
MEEKYRRIKMSNVAFGRRLGNVRGGRDVLRASGFVMEEGTGGGGGYYVLVPSADAWPKLMEARDEVGRLLDGVDSSSSSSVAADVTTGTTTRGGTGVVGGGASAGGTNATMANVASMMRGASGGGGLGDLGGLDASTMRGMLSDPNAIRNLAGMMNVGIISLFRLVSALVYIARSSYRLLIISFIISSPHRFGMTPATYRIPWSET